MVFVGWSHLEFTGRLPTLSGPGNSVILQIEIGGTDKSSFRYITLEEKEKNIAELLPDVQEKNQTH